MPSLSDVSRTLALAGVPAQWAFPAADTLPYQRGWSALPLGALELTVLLGLMRAAG